MSCILSCPHISTPSQRSPISSFLCATLFLFLLTLPIPLLIPPQLFYSTFLPSTSFLPPIGRLKELRRRVDIEPEVSIVRDIKGGEVRIYTDYGRIMRYVLTNVRNSLFTTSASSLDFVLHVLYLSSHPRSKIIFIPSRSLNRHWCVIIYHHLSSLESQQPLFFPLSHLSFLFFHFFFTYARPLFIVGDDQKLTIKKSHIYKIRNSRGNVSGEYGWHDVLYEVSNVHMITLLLYEHQRNRMAVDPRS